MTDAPKPTKKKKTDATRDRVMMFRATDAEAAKIEQAAKRKGLRVADWMRSQLLEAAERRW